MVRLKKMRRQGYGSCPIEAWVLASCIVVRGTGPAPLFLTLGSWPYVLSSRASNRSSNIQEDARNQVEKNQGAFKLKGIKVHSS